MRKRKIIVWYREKYLMIVYEFGRYKKRIITILTGYGCQSQIPVADASPVSARELQRIAIIAKNSAETRSIKFQQKLQKPESREISTIVIMY